MIRKICFITLLITNHACSMDLESQLGQLQNELIALQKILTPLIPSKKITPPPPATIPSQGLKPPAQSKNALEILAKLSQQLSQNAKSVINNLTSLANAQPKQKPISQHNFNTDFLKPFNLFMKSVQNITTFYKEAIEDNKSVSKNDLAPHLFDVYENLDNVDDVFYNTINSLEGSEFSDTSEKIEPILAELRDQFHDQLVLWQNISPLVEAAGIVTQLQKAMEIIIIGLSMNTQKGTQTQSNYVTLLTNIYLDVIKTKELLIDLKNIFTLSLQRKEQGKIISKSELTKMKSPLEELSKVIKKYLQKRYTEAINNPNDWSTKIGRRNLSFKESVEKLLTQDLPAEYATIEELYKRLNA